MNEAQLIRLAEHAGIFTNKTSGELHGYKHNLQKFAELVRQSEREACAKLCDEKALYFQYDFIPPYDVADSCAEEIRARGEA